MKKKFSFALGNIYSWNKDRGKLLDKIIKMNLGVDGVELTFGKKEELFSFNPTKKQITFLKNKKYVTIHAPFRLVSLAKDEKEVVKQLDIISRLYHLVNAKNVVIHPQELPARNLLKKYKMKISTENMPKKKKIDIKKLEKKMKEYKEIGFCLDVSHAYLWSKDETRKIVYKFKNRITQVHFSGAYKKKDHQSLKRVSKDFLKSIDPIKKLNLPIVIEEDMKTKSIKYVKDEIVYIKSLFE